MKTYTIDKKQGWSRKCSVVIGVILLTGATATADIIDSPRSAKLNNPSLVCPEDSVSSQPPSPITSNPGWSDEADSIRSYDNFSGVSAPITGIVWWGGGYNAGTCVRDPESFEVGFYADNGNQPGALISSETLSPDYVETESDAGFGTVRRYEATFAAPVELSSGWVSVYGKGLTGCYFYWANGTGGNGNAYRSGSGSIAADFAFCLISTPPEAAGCCGTGDDDVKTSVKRMLGDYLLVGLGMMSLAVLTITGKGL